MSRPSSASKLATAGLLASSLLLAARTAQASELTLSLDVPADLDGTTYLANQTVHERSGVYALRFDGPAAGLPAGVSINALSLNEDGTFLFTADVPIEDFGTFYGARDVLRWDGVGIGLYISGNDLGLSAAAQTARSPSYVPA